MQIDVFDDAIQVEQNGYRLYLLNYKELGSDFQDMSKLISRFFRYIFVKSNRLIVSERGAISLLYCAFSVWIRAVLKYVNSVA